MKYRHYIALLCTLLLVNSCGKAPYPNYDIIKPEVKFEPKRENLAKMVETLQGRPYVWAEEGPECFDCSGLTYYMYGSMGIELPRVAREQAKVGKEVKVKDLQYGDLIFFSTNPRNPKKITHVGIYLGNGWFTHASTVKREVVYTNLNTSPYYKKHLRVCRRYLPDAPDITLASNGDKPPVWHTPERPLNDTVAASNPAILAKQESVPIRDENITKTTVPHSPLIVEEQPDRAKGSYYVQAGSFAGKPNSSLLYEISRKGLTYRLIEFPKGSKKISKLLIGPYKTHIRAKQMLAQIRQTFQKDAFIARIE